MCSVTSAQRQAEEEELNKALNETKTYANTVLPDTMDDDKARETQYITMRIMF